MEKIENRTKYLRELSKIKRMVVLSDKFMKRLDAHSYFKPYMNDIKALDTNGEKIMFILLELTRERPTCEAMAEVLRASGQTEVADKLANFNKSSGPMALTFDRKLILRLRWTPQTTEKTSNCYHLLKKPRGKCVIINNIDDPQPVKANGLVYSLHGLGNEAKRFKNLFKELYFDTRVISNLTAIQLKEQMEQLSGDKSLVGNEALVMIVISHGQDEKVLGYDACDAIRRKKFGQLRYNDSEARKVISDDVLNILELVNIFADDKCPQLKSKPKLFFFICCRVEDNNHRAKQSEAEVVDPIKVTKKNLKSESAKMDTFVAYSCAKSHKTFFDPVHGYSNFGQALSHSIAQYACEEPLSKIMTRTQERLSEIYNDLNKKKPIGSFATEYTHYAMNKQLFFQPGIPKNEELE